VFAATTTPRMTVKLTLPSPPIFSDERLGASQGRTPRIAFP
jgi:hypothetical protein